MNERQTLDELKRRLTEVLRSSPAQDIEKNLHALASGFFARFDLATREELEVQKALLERAQGRLAALEARIAELEKKDPK
jgi:BMFP domain-containing protein YqiC